jgi:hypothetical protein
MNMIVFPALPNRIRLNTAFETARTTERGLYVDINKNLFCNAPKSPANTAAVLAENLNLHEHNIPLCRLKCWQAFLLIVDKLFHGPTVLQFINNDLIAE